MNIFCFNDYDFSIVELNVMADEAKTAKAQDEKKNRTKVIFNVLLEFMP